MAAPVTLLQVQSASKGFGARQLFHEASFSLNAGDHTGVIGPNGAGKTTLMKIIAGVETLDDGSITKAKSLRISWLPQEDQFTTDLTVEDFVMGGASLPIWEVKSLGIDLGLSESIFEKPVMQLSGGFRMRCKLLRLIAQEPDVLLLDEPTNYLDLETLLALEEFLISFKGAFLMISHDREFLRRTTDHILEIENGNFTQFGGNIDDYFEQKRMMRELIEKQALSQEAKRKEVLAFAARFGAKASKARQVQSRVRQMEKEERIEVAPIPISARIHIPRPVPTGKVVLRAEEVTAGYPGKVIMRDINFHLVRGDHLGVVGLNGAGKTTLLKTLAGTLAPLAGEVLPGHNVSVALYNQHVSEGLGPNDTVYESLMEKAHPDVLPQEAKDLAGTLLFSGDDIKKKIRVLSGGEKARVCLGRVLLGKSPCLLLDEPTNHLDFHTVEALTQALVAYEGTVIIVSHDRSFISRIATKIIEVGNGTARTYPGTYDEYVWSLQQQRTHAHSKPDAKPRTRAEKKSSHSHAQPKNNAHSLRELEKKAQLLDESIKAKTTEIGRLSDELSRTSGPQIAAISQDLSDALQAVQRAEEEWLELQTQLESLKKP